MPTSSETADDLTTLTLPRFERAVIATDASLSADGAVSVAHALAARDGTTVAAISIVEPVPFPLPVSDLSMTPPALPDMEQEALEARRAGMRTQYDRLGLQPPDELSITLGTPVGDILRHTASCGADLLVLGLGRHAAVDRLFGSETALRAVRDAELPVLAVPGRVTALPQHALVGTDFDASSVAAARAAARLVGPHGRITLVHVDAVAEPVPAMLADWPPHVLDRVNDAFARQIAQLRLPETLQVDTVPLAGQIGRELVGCAQRLQADVLVVGRHQRSLMERMVLGSVATRVIRTAGCAVMVVPRSP